MNDKNFMLYRASAGSGKTYTLVREFLTLCLSSDNVTYNNILAVTFTNKAANEMKVKILNNLAFQGFQVFPSSKPFDFE